MVALRLGEILQRGTGSTIVTQKGAKDTMNRDELLLHDHVRVRKTASRIFIEVLVSDDEGSDQAARWTLVAALPLAATSGQVSRARMLVLADYRYFRVCDTCSEKYPSSVVRSRGDGTDICRECDA